MKIGINGRAFSISEPGGAVQSAKKVTKALASETSQQLSVFGHQSITSDIPTVNVVGAGVLSNSQIYGLIWEQLFLPKFASRKGFDVLFCPNGNSPIYDVNVPTVVLIHDILNYFGFSSRPYHILQRFRVPRMVNAADRIITVSEFTKSELTREFSIGERKVDVVPNGIDDIYLTDDPGDPLDLPDDYLLYVGGMHERKNLDGVLATFLHLKDAGRIHHDLVLVGPSRKLSYEQSKVDWDSVRKRQDVHVMGFISRRELKFSYRNASVFLYPSRYEGFGIPPLESMASGTPVVSSKTSALPEILGDAAYLVNPENIDEIVNATYNLIKNKELRSDYIERGIDRASKYTWERAANQIDDILREVGQKEIDIQPGS